MNSKTKAPISVTTLIVLALLAVPAAGKGPFAAQAEALNAALAGKTATAKIDIPVVRSLYVFPDGSFDEKRYYERIRKFPTGLAAGESTAIQRVVVERDRIALCLHRQCGLPKATVGRGTKGISKRKTGKIEIEFGRSLTADDVSTEVVLRALARVLTVEGVAAPSDFSPEAILQTAGGGASPAPAPPPAATGGGQPAIQLVSAEVDPPKIAPGTEVKLIAHFEVSGGDLPVTEEREILLDGRPLLSAPRATTETWPPGRHRTELLLTLPAAAAPGVYSFRLTLRGGGLEQRKEALFQVQ